jgi:hypothetical protein
VIGVAKKRSAGQTVFRPPLMPQLRHSKHDDVNGKMPTGICLFLFQSVGIRAKSGAN